MISQRIPFGSARAGGRIALGCFLLLTPLPAAATQAPAQGQESKAAEVPPPQDWTVDNFRWTGQLAPSTRLVIRNRFGDVRLRAADADEVELSAMIQRRTADPIRPVVEVRHRRGTLLLEVVYPQPPQGDLHRVDIAVFMPAGAFVKVRTADGLIQARGLTSDLVARSDGGNVILSTTGTARVRTDRGHISAELRPGGAWIRQPRLASRTGDITVTLSTKLQARFDIRARGAISVPSEARLDRRGPRRAEAVVGHTTDPSLSLRTKRGSVTLLTSEVF